MILIDNCTDNGANVIKSELSREGETLQQKRDVNIKRIKARKSHRCYGMGLGIILLDEVYPGFPGDVRNASAYPFPIQYAVAEGVDIDALCYAEDKSNCLDPILAAAGKLENMGCRAIAAECGYFAYFQKEVAGHMKVPVFMSSLLQVPWAQSVIGPDRVVGILMSESSNFPCLSERHIVSMGIRPGSNFVLGATMDPGVCVEFDRLWDAARRPDPPSAEYEKAAIHHNPSGRLFKEN